MLNKVFVFLLLPACASSAQSAPVKAVSEYRLKGLAEPSMMVLSTFAGDSVSCFQAKGALPEAALAAAACCEQLSPQGSTQTAPVEEANQTASDSSPREAEPEGKQPKRILWIIPNYRAVSADTQLPRLPFKGKFWLASQDSFDYSSFLLAGILAGVGQAKNATPEFRQGAAGFGRYYWHSFADQAVGNYLTEAIVPIAAKQDPRYYTLGHGGLFHRTGYAITRLLVTRTDSGGENFNFSEIVGNGAGAGVSDLYYPAPERTWTKTGQKWLTQVAIDGVFNVFKEFWPDINRTVFGSRY